MPSTLETETIYWIATRPNLQIEVINEISLQGVEVLLDKPIVSNFGQLRNLRSIISRSDSKFTVAQPWRHSRLWQTSKMPKSEIQEIKIERTFTEFRDYLSPTLDWLPHDFSLLIDLGIEFSSLNFDKFNFNEGLDFELFAQTPDGIDIIIHISRANIRSSTWRILLKNKTSLLIKFHNRTSTTFNPKGEVVEEWEQSISEHPISNVITQFRMLGNSDLIAHIDCYEKYFELGGK